MEKLKNISIGVTSKCSATCFSCDRHMFKYPQNYDVPLEVFEKIMPYFEKFILIGGFGDFIYHSQSMAMAKLICDNNKSLLIDSNGSQHGREYWTELGKTMNKEETIMRFNLDAIDTEIDPHKGTNTKKVLDNMENFIAAGGTAHVKTVLWKFNESKLDNMKRHFRDMGVKVMFEQTSKLYHDTGPLSAPDSKIKKHPHGNVETFFKLATLLPTKVEQCQWDDRGMMYINELGELTPCCHLDGELIGLEHNIMPFSELAADYYADPKFYGKELVDLYLKNKELININNVSFEEAYYNEFNKYIRDNFTKIKKCGVYCGLNRQISDVILYDLEETSL